MDWFFAFWFFLIAGLSLFGRKKQDAQPLNRWMRERFGLAPNYYEGVSTTVFVGASIVGLCLAAKALGLL